MGRAPPHAPRAVARAAAPRRAPAEVWCPLGRAETSKLRVDLCLDRRIAGPIACSYATTFSAPSPRYAWRGRWCAIMSVRAQRRGARTIALLPHWHVAEPFHRRRRDHARVLGFRGDRFHLYNPFRIGEPAHDHPRRGGRVVPLPVLPPTRPNG